MYVSPSNASSSNQSVPRRVVVTGVGVISSLAPSAEETWQRLLAGESGIRSVEGLDPTQHPCRVRGNVDDAAIPNRFLTGKVARNTSRFARMAVEAAGEALQQAGLLGDDHQPIVDLVDGGTSIGTCVGGTYDDMLPVHESFLQRGTARVPPHLHVMFPHNLASYTIQSRFGLGGPSSTVVTACATGAQAIGDGFHAVKYGRAPLMVAGATESTDHPLFMAGFAAMRALVVDSNETPQTASRPFDASRAGFALGEGAGMVVVEELEHARSRGATILAELLGYGTSNDAYHPIAPHPESAGAARAIEAALADGGIAPEQVDHINAHAASTPAGDLAESRAIHRVFGSRGGEIPVTSVKGSFGHCMAAAGALEGVAAIQTIHTGCIPPTINYQTPDPAIALNIVHGAPQAAEINVMTKHSFGLGGQNAVLVLGRYEG